MRLARHHRHQPTASARLATESPSPAAAVYARVRPMVSEQDLLLSGRDSPGGAAASTVVAFSCWLSHTTVQCCLKLCSGLLLSQEAQLQQVGRLRLRVLQLRRLWQLPSNQPAQQTNPGWRAARRRILESSQSSRRPRSSKQSSSSNCSRRRAQAAAQPLEARTPSQSERNDHSAFMSL